jgi:lysophospholipase L1-like esterase
MIIAQFVNEVVFFGANDASLPEAPNKQHIPLDEFSANVEKIITHPQVVAHKPRIILVAPPPINEHLWWPRDESSGYSSVTRVASATKDYADAACALGAKLNVPVVNLWSAFMRKAGFETNAWKVGDPLPGSLGVPQNGALMELMYDGKQGLFQCAAVGADSFTGLHFNPAGYEILFQELMKLIAERWPDQTPDELDMVLPRWNDAAAWKAWESGHTLAE